MKIIIKNVEYSEQLKGNGEIEKRVKKSVIFNEIMEKIKNWEQRMKDMLVIDHVEIIEKEEDIVEGFTDYSNHPEQNPRFVFILPLVKYIVKKLNEAPSVRIKKLVI